MDNLREELEELVKSPGWLRFREHVEREWGTRDTGGGIRFEQAAAKAANLTDDATAINQLRQITVARREVHTLIQWVYDALKQATKEDRELQPVGPVDWSRRGGL